MSSDTYRRGLCHGGDFLVVASRKRLDSFGKLLESKFDVRGSEVVGFGSGVSKMLKMLNRSVKVNDAEDCVELEADEKHVRLMLED